jgi:hypothetical protein
LTATGTENLEQAFFKLTGVTNLAEQQEQPQ